MRVDNIFHHFELFLFLQLSLQSVLLVLLIPLNLVPLLSLRFQFLVFLMAPLTLQVIAPTFSYWPFTSASNCCFCSQSWLRLGNLQPILHFCPQLNHHLLNIMNDTGPNNLCGHDLGRKIGLVLTRTLMNHTKRKNTHTYSNYFKLL